MNSPLKECESGEEESVRKDTVVDKDPRGRAEVSQVEETEVRAMQKVEPACVKA